MQFGEKPSRWGEPPLVADALAWVLAVVVVVLIACTPPTAPDKAAAPAPTPSPTTATASGGGEPAASPAPPTSSGIGITARGAVDNTTGETLTACLYIPPYGGGVLVGEWKLPQGRTPRPWKNDTCFPVKGQIEVIGEDSCPPKPPMEYLDARIIEIPAGKTPEECEGCIEDPKEETVCTPCSSYNEGCEKTCTKTVDYKCKPDPEPEVWTEPCECECEWQGRFCVTYLSNSGDSYYTTDDGQSWLTGLNLARGEQNTCWGHEVDGSRLCLYWRNERIGCAVASQVTASWHGKVAFRSECVYP